LVLKVASLGEFSSSLFVKQLFVENCNKEPRKQRCLIGDKQSKELRAMICGTWNIHSLSGKLIEEMNSIERDIFCLIEIEKKDNASYCKTRSVYA